MNDLFLRIDDRLIHGQVVEGWLPFLKPQAILVASDEVAASETQKTLMAIAVPDSIELRVESVDNAPKRIAELANQGKRLLVLVPGPREALCLIDGGVGVRSINVGGLHHAAGKIQVGKALFLSPDDKKALRDLSARGVQLEGRAVPGETPSDLTVLLQE